MQARMRRQRSHLGDSATRCTFRVGRLCARARCAFFHKGSVDTPLICDVLLVILLVIPTVGVSNVAGTQVRRHIARVTIHGTCNTSHVSVVIELFLRGLLAIFLNKVLKCLFSYILI